MMNNTPFVGITNTVLRNDMSPLCRFVVPIVRPFGIDG